jgi:hypothetical protein
VIVRNTIAMNDTGVVVAPAVDQVALWQNTIFGNFGPGIRYDAPAAGAASGQQHDVRNNVFAGNTGAAIQTAGGFSALSANAFFQNAAACTGCEREPPGIQSDPVLMDPGAGDYRLAPGSPCIDAGEDLGLGYKGNAPDLGAFEHDP